MLFFRWTRIVYTFLIFCLVGGVVLFGAGCDTVRLERSDTPAVPSLADAVNAPREIAIAHESLRDGVEHVSYAFSTSSQARLELYGFPQDRYAFRLASDETGKTLGGWREDADARAVAGINAMYFLDDLTPAGLFVADGVVQRDHPFDWDLSALLTVDEEGKLAVRATEEEPDDLAELTHAAQSYPLLILNGRSLLTSDSGKTSRRSFVGTDTDGRVWIGVLTDGEASLYRLGQLLAELEIPWENVLNLDGGASSGMFVRDAADAYYPSFTEVPTVLFVEKR